MCLRSGQLKAKQPAECLMVQAYDSLAKGRSNELRMPVH